MVFPETFKGWVGILGTGVTFTLTYTLFFFGAGIIGAARASMISIIEPVLTILIAILLVQEWLTAVQWLGVVLVVVSLLVMEAPRKTR